MSIQQTAQAFHNGYPDHMMDPQQAYDPYLSNVRPDNKRAASSSADSDTPVHPQLKKHRMSLQHTDSARSSSTAVSTATSNPHSPSEGQTPPSDDGIAPGISMDAYINGLPRIGNVPAIQPAVIRHPQPYALRNDPSVPARFEDMIRSYAEARNFNVQLQPRGVPDLPPHFQQQQQPEGLVHGTRRSKANAMQHLGEALADEEEDSFDMDDKPSRSGNKRLSKKKASAAAKAVPRKEEAQEEEGDEKRAQFLERNRLAACKSRQKKKEWIKSLEVQGEDLTRQNGDLQVLVAALREEIMSLRSALSAHSGCTVRHEAPAVPTEVAMTHSPPQLNHHHAHEGQSQMGPGQQATWPSLSPMIPTIRPPSPTTAFRYHTPSVLQSPGVIEFGNPQLASGLTPLMNGAMDSQDYFSSMNGSQHQRTFGTPDLARSLGYGN